MIALHTRTEAFDVQTTGSGSLMSLEKTTNYPNLRATYDPSNQATHGRDRRLLNPKVSVLQDFFDDTENKATFHAYWYYCTRLFQSQSAPAARHLISLSVNQSLCVLFLCVHGSAVATVTNRSTAAAFSSRCKVVIITESVFRIQHCIKDMNVYELQPKSPHSHP